MYTTMAFVALTLGNLSTAPAWQNDYRTAQREVSATGKPMVVFVGAGKADSVVREGAFSPEMNRVLSQKFVCLYVDTSKPAGQELAKAFQITKGVVISDRTGTKQAFSLAGEINSVELSKTLLVYADEKQAPKKTDTVVKDPKAVTPAPAAPAAPAATCPTGNCGQSSGCGTGCCGKSMGCTSGCCGKTMGCSTGSCGKTYSGGCCLSKLFCCGKSSNSGCGTTTYSSGCCGKTWGGWGCCSKGGSSCGTTTSCGTGCCK
jgi:hypothetical protein